jgi:hypothetical protein
MRARRPDLASRNTNKVNISDNFTAASIAIRTPASEHPTTSQGRSANPPSKRTHAFVPILVGETLCMFFWAFERVTSCCPGKESRCFEELNLHQFKQCCVLINFLDSAKFFHLNRRMAPAPRLLHAQSLKRRANPTTHAPMWRDVPGR